MRSHDISLKALTVLSLVAALVSSPPSMPGADIDEAPVTLPQTVVTAQKEAEDWIVLPLSVTAVAVPADAADQATVRELSKAVPGIYVNEFTSRAVSNPFFRGVGGSPGNPGVTTYIDSVPQLNSYSSNIELVDVERVEFVRGPQGALFGRNTPGGLVNIVSMRPSKAWTGHAEAAYGNFAYKDLRGGVSGPIEADRLTMSLAGGYSERQGFTRNRFNGEDIDSREGLFGKTQLLYTPSEEFEVRLLLTGERNRDGDYALGDLGELRKHPRRVTRDFTDGYNDRDILAPTLIATRHGEAVDVESTSAYVFWKNDGLTDLDYGVATPQNSFLNATRRNEEKQDQFTQELRLSSPEDRPVLLSDSVDLRWQGGVFLFYRDYEQETANAFAPPLAMLSGSSDAYLTDYGAGFYGQGRFELQDRVELSLGVRADLEDKQAELGGSRSARIELDDSFFEVTPQFGIIWKLNEGQTLYATVAAGYKAGGFNPPPAGAPGPDGTESYDTEHSWNYEVGYKARALDGRIEGALALFYVHWEDLQLNQQYSGLPGQYYIGNAGAAVSKGVELQLTGRPLKWLDLFGSVAAMESEFLSGSTSFNANRGVNQSVGGNDLPFAPRFTATGGAEASWNLRQDLTLFVRGQVTGYGEFQYDASNDASQDAYTLADFRAGVRGKFWFVEGFIANAFDEEYVPIAIPYALLGAPSGYVGESGAPATFGARLGLFF